MPRWLLPMVLFVSLAANVFIGGAFVGSHMARSQAAAAPAAAPVRPRNPLAAALETLSPEQQAAWREQMPSYGETFGPRVREARQTLRRTMRGFGDEPFDANATLAAMKQARAVEAEGRAEMDRRIVAFVATLPPQDRARFGEALARPALGGRRAAGRGALPDR